MLYESKVSDVLLRRLPSCPGTLVGLYTHDVKGQAGIRLGWLVYTLCGLCASADPVLPLRPKGARLGWGSAPASEGLMCLCSNAVSV